MNARPARGPADADAVAHVFVDALDDRCEITGDDGHHLQRVRRLTNGEPVTAADGSGAWRSYEVTGSTTGRLTLEARGDAQIASEPPIAVSLAVALTKGGLDDVVAAVTELGVARVLPVRTARTVVRWDEARATRGRACGTWRAKRRCRAGARGSRSSTRSSDLAALVDRPGLVVADRDGVSPLRARRPVPATGGRCSSDPRAASLRTSCPGLRAAACARSARAAGGDGARRGGRRPRRRDGAVGAGVTSVVGLAFCCTCCGAIGSMTFTERAVIIDFAAPRAVRWVRLDTADAGSGRGSIALANSGARVGERLRAIRRQKGLSLHDVEARSSLEFKASVLGAYERGERAISVPRLLRLAEIYEVPADQLLPRELEGEISLVETGATGGIDLNGKFTIDLVRLHELDDPDAHILDRFATSLQRERQDFNGRMLTIRRSDLRVLASCMGRSLEELGSRLEQLGLRAAVSAG